MLHQQPAGVRPIHADDIRAEPPPLGDLRSEKGDVARRVDHLHHRPVTHASQAGMSQAHIPVVGPSPHSPQVGRHCSI